MRDAFYVHFIYILQTSNVYTIYVWGQQSIFQNRLKFSSDFGIYYSVEILL